MPPNAEFAAREFEYELVSVTGWLEQGRVECCLMFGVALGLALAGTRGPTRVDPIHPILLRHPTPLFAFEIVAAITWATSDLSLSSDRVLKSFQVFEDPSCRIPTRTP